MSASSDSGSSRAPESVRQSPVSFRVLFQSMMDFGPDLKPLLVGRSPSDGSTLPTEAKEGSCT